MLYKLQWELTAITPLDYLDHVIPRLDLGLDSSSVLELRRRTETVLVLCSTEYSFVYTSPSLLAAAACQVMLEQRPEVSGFQREIMLRLQTITHAATVRLFSFLFDFAPFPPSFFILGFFLFYFPYLFPPFLVSSLVDSFLSLLFYPFTSQFSLFHFSPPIFPTVVFIFFFSPLFLLPFFSKKLVFIHVTVISY